MEPKRKTSLELNKLTPGEFIKAINDEEIYPLEGKKIYILSEMEKIMGIISNAWEHTKKQSRELSLNEKLDILYFLRKGTCFDGKPFDRLFPIIIKMGTYGSRERSLSDMFFGPGREMGNVYSYTGKGYFHLNIPGLEKVVGDDMRTFIDRSRVGSFTKAGRVLRYLLKDVALSHLVRE